jgi:hypothetical protein
MIDLLQYIDCICCHVPLQTIAIVFNPADLSSVARAKFYVLILVVNYVILPYCKEIKTFFI